MIPIGDIDYIIMTNAHEDSFLWEVFAEYEKEYPGVSAPEALCHLKTRLTELVLEGKAGVYSLETGRCYESPEEYRYLEISEALAVINEDGNWDVPAADTKVLNCLYARDNNYFGNYYPEAMKSAKRRKV
ncbi:MAG: hypothetical protein HYS23_00475 [Geobacter sp.]|nr:hypothetical protein [Geobacter sp.]